jgi:hypothetical protein
MLKNRLLASFFALHNTHRRETSIYFYYEEKIRYDQEQRGPSGWQLRARSDDRRATTAPTSTADRGRSSGFDPL